MPAALGVSDLPELPDPEMCMGGRRTNGSAASIGEAYLILIFNFVKLTETSNEVTRMASGKGILINALGGLVLRQGSVRSVREVAPRFRWICVQGETLRGLDWTPGDKVQVLLPQLDMRTYTPLSWDRAAGTTELLLYLNQSPTESPAAEHPGTRWIRTVREGDACRFVGPQRSLSVASDSPVVLFGDETSFAVARALRSATKESLVCVFEVSARSECAQVLAELGLPDSVCVERSADDSHLEQIHEELERRMKEQKRARLLMTGRAQAIQALQRRRRAAGQARSNQTRAYWSLGKAGLD